MTASHLICWICKKPVPIENCKTDERHLPVHEECYVAWLTVKSKQGPASEAEKS
ncbi:MAG TPA: hypothetical protein VJQ59_01690 [Candidatus Sulfotelmatobacter sp.]|nr:hypothetical protein [Candidatus Sulfotelmatobacter sp.]